MSSLSGSSMTRYPILALLAACVGGAPSSSTDPTTPADDTASSTTASTASTASTGHTGSSPTDNPGTTGHTGSGATTGAVVTVGLQIFEEDRQCFGVLFVDLQASFWSEWDSDYGGTTCYTREDGGAPHRRYPVSTTDGLCLWFFNPLEGECSVEDPWIRPCEELEGCCERDSIRNWSHCSPDIEYQP